MFKLLDNLIRRVRQIRPILKVLGNERGETEGGEGEEGGEGTNDFFDSLSEENRGANVNGVATLSKFKTVDDLGKSYVELQTKIGQKGVLIPKEGAPPEEKEAYLNAIGRPAKPEEYKFDAIEGLHESIKVTPETTAFFNNSVHKIGLTNEQANAINKMQLEFVNNAIKEQDRLELEASQKADTALRTEWKDKFDANKDLVSKMVAKLGDEFVQALGDKASNPSVLKGLGILALSMSEDQIGKLGSFTSSSGGSKEEASAKIAEYANQLATDPKSAIADVNHPGHKAAVADRTKQYNIAHGGGE